MSLLYKHYYTGYHVYTVDYIDSLIEQQRSTPIPTDNRLVAMQASIRNLHHSSSFHLQLLSNVTARVSRLMVVTPQM